MGESGQQRLLQSRIAVVGAGGLGSATLTYLAAAGIGHLTVLDHDRVSLSNLQRQILYEQADIDRLKVEAAADRLEELASDLSLTLIESKLDADNAEQLLANHDLVLDGTDRFATRFIIAAACRKLKIPLISAAVQRFELQLSTFTPYLFGQPCYRCLVPQLPAEAKTCTETGILGPVAGIAGCWQATEAIKHLLSIGESLQGKLLQIDLLTNRARLSILLKDPACPDFTQS